MRSVPLQYVLAQELLVGSQLHAELELMVNVRACYEGLVESKHPTLSSFFL